MQVMAFGKVWEEVGEGATQMIEFLAQKTRGSAQNSANRMKFGHHSVTFPVTMFLQGIFGHLWSLFRLATLGQIS